MDEALFDLLRAYRNPGVWNQYRDTDPELDRPDGAAVRRRNLRVYLEAFAGAQFMLVGEAAGYAGSRFTGIAFICEAQLVGARALSWTQGRELARSSTAERPWVERSAQIVWAALGERRDCLLWNAFPWHPFGARGPLSNRHPGRALPAGLKVLRCMLAMFPAARPVAVGLTAKRALDSLGLRAPMLRHPSHGGKGEFVAGLAALTGS